MRHLTRWLALTCGTAALLPATALAGSWSQLPPVRVDSSCFPQPRTVEPMPMASPAAPPMGSARSGGGQRQLEALGYVSGGATAQTRSAPARKARASAESAADAFDADGAYDEAARMPFAMPEAEPVVRSEDANERRAPVPPAYGPRVDWGGVVHLSNDDSMSLASAQRLLYALDRNAPISTDQIRPHELLNYFTFDTHKPAAGATFAVAASAERKDADTLGLTLAVTGATPPRPDLDLTLLIDRSGSMSAEGRMDYTQRALRLMTDRLHAGDRVNLVLFDNVVCTPLEGFVVGRDDPALLRTTIERMQPRNSTDLDSGLREAYRVATSQASGSRAGRVVVFTDALLNTGDVDPHSVSEIGRALDDHDIRLTGVGVGRDFRDDVLDRLTEKGKGAYVFLGSERVVDRLFGVGFDALVQTLAEDVRFALDLPPSLGMERFYGEEMSRDPADVQPVNFQAGNTQVFFQDLAIRDGRLDPRDPLTLSISWTDPATHARRGQTVTTTVGEALGADPHNTRKARALMAWTDVVMARSMGADACGAPLTDYRRTLGGLQGDAEIAYVTELLGHWCQVPGPLVAWTEPAWTRIRLDSDVPVTEVALACPSGSWRQAMTTSDTVARFEAAPGPCNVTLYGTVPMTARIDIPATGADLRCVVRGGRLHCG